MIVISSVGIPELRWGTHKAIGLGKKLKRSLREKATDGQVFN